MALRSSLEGGGGVGGCRGWLGHWLRGAGETKRIELRECVHKAYHMRDNFDKYDQLDADYSCGTGVSPAALTPPSVRIESLSGFLEQRFYLTECIH